MPRRITIVGAGPGGLAAAMLLARSGAEVTVLERQERIGGRTGIIEMEGFRFDVGPTFFLYPRVLEELFAACGRSLRREVELIRVDPLYNLVFESGGELRVHNDAQRLAKAVAELCPHDAEAIPRYMADNRMKLEAFRPVLESPFHGMRSLMAPNVLKALRHLRPWRTVETDLREHFRDPRVRLAFSFQSKYLGMSPFKCPSLFTILSFLEHEHGIWHPRGGCHAVIEAMARVARQMGVRIRTGEEVTGLRFEGRRVTRVVTPQGEHACDGLVVNADFAHAMRRLVPDNLRRRWHDRKLEKAKFSCSTFMLYLGIEGLVDLDHHTILLSRDYERNLAEIEAGEAPPTNPSIYVQNACITDPELAPRGHSTLYVLVPVGNDSGRIDWPAIAPAFRAKILKRLELLGLHDIESRIRVERMVTPHDWRDGFHIHRGATFNLAHNIGQMLHNRPRNRFEDLDGVYLVGGGTHPGSGLPVIFEGARITSRLLAQDLGLSLNWAANEDQPFTHALAAEAD